MDKTMTENRFCQIFGIQKPVICGPMAWTSTAPLVAAVSNAGGLGILGVGFAPLEFVEEQIRETKKLTDKPFGINVILIPDYALLDKITQVVANEAPAVVYADTLLDLDENLSRTYFAKWHDLGSKIIVKASDIKDAVTAEKAGADAIVVKGWEGGGHVTYETTMVLVPQAKDILSVPLIAGGGIADGRGMAAAIALGAEAIEMGTVFLAAEETLVHPNVKQAVVDAGDMASVITGTCTGEPCRQIKNVLSERLLQIEAENVQAKAAELLRPVAESSLKMAMMEGDMENGAVMAGQIAPLIKSIRPAQAIIDETLAQCRDVLAKMADYRF